MLNLQYIQRHLQQPAHQQPADHRHWIFERWARQDVYDTIHIWIYGVSIYLYLLHYCTLETIILFLYSTMRSSAAHMYHMIQSMYTVYRIRISYDIYIVWYHICYDTRHTNQSLHPSTRFQIPMDAITSWDQLSKTILDPIQENSVCWIPTMAKYR